MTYTVTVPVLWSTAIEFFFVVFALLIIYWLWRFILGIIT